jgi:hypothetical protein
MKRIIFFIFLIISHISYAQNVGIGTNTPEQKLDINGAVKIGNADANRPGTIRYNNETFEGGNGTNWKSLEGLPSKSIIIAQAPDTAFLKTLGFSVIKTMDIWDTLNIQTTTNFTGSWQKGFPVGSGSIPTPTTISESSGSLETVFYNDKLIYLSSDGFLYAYNINSQQWNKLPNKCPLLSVGSLAISGFGVTLVGDEIYVTGGYIFAPPSSGTIQSGAKYNLITNTWLAIADLPVTSYMHFTSAIGTDIYLINGRANTTSFTTNKMYKYDTKANKWSSDLFAGSRPMPLNYIESGDATTWKNKIIFPYLTLWKKNNNYHIPTNVYDPLTNIIEEIPNPLVWPYDAEIQFWEPRITQYNDKLYITGRILDTTKLGTCLISDFSNVPSNYECMMNVYFEVDLNTGIATQMNSCNIMKDDISSLQYNPTNKLIYALGSNTANSSIFDRRGSVPCSAIEKRYKGYWSYMKKN